MYFTLHPFPPPLAGAPSGAVLSPVWLSVAGGRVCGELEMPVGELGWATGRSGDGYHPPAALSVFWVQMLVAGLVVPLLLGATLTYTYCRCHPCKAMGPSKCTYEHTHILRGPGSGWVAHSPLGLAMVGKLRQRVMGVGCRGTQEELG